MIFEIYGLPGSGKTYFGKQLGEKEKLTNLIEFERETFIGKVLKKILNNFIIIRYKTGKFWKIIDLKEDRINARYNPNRALEYYQLRLWYLLVIYKYCPKKVNLVVDEGIYHTFITMAVEYGISKEDFMVNMENITTLLLDRKVDLTVIYQQTNVELAMQSIIIRNRKKANIDFLVGDDLKFFLIEYEKYCELTFNNNKHELNRRE